ncbi:MAG: hypothetical protein KA807_16895 [Prolixibacteraceae bacterium]|nr:hypothetical protein [Prolixibacteraceae bacterium]
MILKYSDNKVLKVAIPIIAFLFGIWYFCIRLLGYNLEYIPGDLGDSRFINYLLEHGFKWISGDIKSFWDAGFMYPFKNTIALSDSMLGTLPFYSVWRLIGFSAETSYQLWWIIICTLNFWISYIVFNKWFKRYDIATILSWIFAFTIFNIGQLNYMQMIVRFMVPVVFYAAYRMMEKPSGKYLFIYASGIVYQFYCAMYTGFYLLYFSLLFIGLYLIITKKWNLIFDYFKKDRIFKTLLLLVLPFAALLWLFIPYLKMAGIVGMLYYVDVRHFLPFVNSYFFPHESSVTWNFLFENMKPDVELWWLQYLFPGMIPLSVLILSPFYLVYNRIKKRKTEAIIKTLIISSLIIVLLHLRTEKNLTLYALFFYLPGISSMKVLIRFMNVELFILLLIAGYTMLKFRKGYLLVILFLVFTDNLFSPGRVPRSLKSELAGRKEVMITEIKKHDYKYYEAIAYINTSQPEYVENIDMMLAAQSLGIKTINGYSSYCPVEMKGFLKNKEEEGLYSWLEKNGIEKSKVLLIKTE